MCQVDEVYVDALSGISVVKDGVIFKLLFTTMRPEGGGKLVHQPAIVLTMSSKSASEMIAILIAAVKGPQHLNQAKN